MKKARPIIPVWFDPILELANADLLPASMSARDSRELRKRLQLRTSVTYLPDGTMVSGIDVRWSNDEPRKAQQALVEILDGLRKNGPTARICRALARIIRGVNFAGYVQFVPAEKIDGPLGPPPPALLPDDDADIDYRLLRTTTLKPGSLQQWCAIAVAELISRGFGHRVRSCGLPSCDIFFVNWIRGGPKRAFCSTSHASQARVRRKRKRDAKRDADNWPMATIHTNQGK